MPGPITVKDGSLVRQDSSAQLVYVFDYDAKNLAADAEFEDEGTVTVTPDDLDVDEVALLAGNRKVQLRIAGGVVGTDYRIEHVATTAEDPTQTKVAHFTLRIT